MISWKLKTQNHRPIGLDIGNNYIRMIQLSVSEGRIGVLAADKVQIDSSINGDPDKRRSFVVSTIKQMLEESDFRGREVVSCLPNDKLKVTSFRIAETQDDKVEHIMKKEAAQRFGLDPEKDSINYVMAGSVRQGDETKNELILFGAENETIKEHIEMLEEAGLIPVGIDTVPCALFRSSERMMRRHEDREHTVVFVDVGGKFTTVVFGRGGEISFIKQIPIGGERFNEQVASKLGVSIDEAQLLRNKLQAEKTMYASVGGRAVQGQYAATEEDNQQLDATTRQAIVDAISSVAEELTREISLCFRYYTVTFRGKRAERAVFSGGSAYEGILLNILRRQLTVEVEVAQPFRSFEMMNITFDSDKRGLLCDWAVATGLGLK